ncbi:MAG: pyridoxal phosphate-dependent aminotransferase [Deltaproteobacteria bacterium]|nr:pyridoxal phosphate-dependent aminotransferase [Deltaproteobacteria bacterium]MBW2416664.1 pyridoxal phosphate-dependent aminotransferase [Deltaproteobacteria bacterium]
MSFDDLDPRHVRATHTGEKWHRYADDVLPAWVADMDFAVAEPIQRALRAIADDCDLGYPINPRADGLPAVFADRAREKWSWEIDPHRVEVIADVVQGLYIGIDVFSEPGDGVLVQTPIYPPFLLSPPECGRRVVVAELAASDSGYEIDFDAVRAAIDDRTRVFMLCNPHNPTGRVFTRAELEQLAAIAVERDLIVLADEIHADLLYDGREHIPFATLGPEVEARTITFTSATKAFNIAGLRCAIAIAGSRDLQTRFNSIPRHVRGGLNGPGMAATAVAWTECEDWLDELRAYLQANRDFLAGFVRDQLPAVRHITPQSTYLAWLDCRELGLEPNPGDWFEKHARVGLSRGHTFGDEFSGFARLNFATSRSILTEVLERMAKSLTR